MRQKKKIDSFTSITRQNMMRTLARDVGVSVYRVVERKLAVCKQTGKLFFHFDHDYVLGVVFLEDENSMAPYGTGPVLKARNGILPRVRSPIDPEGLSFLLCQFIYCVVQVLFLCLIQLSDLLLLIFLLCTLHIVSLLMLGLICSSWWRSRRRARKFSMYV